MHFLTKYNYINFEIFQKINKNNFVIFSKRLSCIYEMECESHSRAHIKNTTLIKFLLKVPHLLNTIWFTYKYHFLMFYFDTASGHSILILCYVSHAELKSPLKQNFQAYLFFLKNHSCNVKNVPNCWYFS